MNKALLIVYEPALFLIAALGWAAWELWSVRTKKPKPKADDADGSPSGSG